MNPRIRELAQEAGFYKYGSDFEEIIEKFAELIMQECKENFAKVWYEQGMDIQGNEIGKFLTRFEEHFGVDR